MKIQKTFLATITFATLLIGAASAQPLQKLKTRCGWFEKPTPANAWLIDRDGQWIIGTQGGHQAEGDWPNFKDSQWVKTNINYGYGCACLKVMANQRTHEITRIRSAQARSLDACRRDRTLKKRI
jgi:Protein of unknown function (DUF4087)